MRSGYDLEVSDLINRPGDPDRVRFVLEPEASGPIIAAVYKGFRTAFAVGEGGVVPTVTAIVGQPPRNVHIFSRGPASSALLDELSPDLRARVAEPKYRERVF